MAWCHPGDKASSEPMAVSLPTYMCFTLPHWVNRQNAPPESVRCHIYIRFTCFLLLVLSLNFRSKCHLGDSIHEYLIWCKPWMCRVCIFWNVVWKKVDHDIIHHTPHILLHIWLRRSCYFTYIWNRFRGLSQLNQVRKRVGFISLYLLSSRISYVLRYDYFDSLVATVQFCISLSVY